MAVSWRAHIGWIALFMLDTVTITGLYLLADGIRRHVLPRMISDMPEYPALTWTLRPIGLFVLPWLIFMAHQGLYRARIPFSLEWQRILRAGFWTLFMVASIVFVARLFPHVSRAVVLMHWVFCIGLLPLVRRAGKFGLRMLGFWSKPVWVVGDAAFQRDIVRYIRQHPAIGWDPRPAAHLPTAHARGTDLIVQTTVLRRLGCTVLELEPRFDEIYVWVGNPEILSTNTEIEIWDGFYFLRSRGALYKGWNRLVKRGMDLALLGIFAPFAGLATVLIALCIKLDSRGPVFFAHPRFGRDGRLFRCWKFRTMYLDADDRLETYLRAHPEAREEWLAFRKLRGTDPRITRVGRFLRRWSLDELPQLWNVARGEMSFVGPRPYALDERERLGAQAAIIWRVRPGLTGLWQTRGRSELSFDERIRLDVFYVYNWNIWMDLEILIRTVWVILHGRGAY